MTVFQVQPKEVESLAEFSDVFDVSINELLKACDDEGLTSALVETYNEYMAGDEDETIASPQNVPDEEFYELLWETAPGREYSIMVRTLANRDKLYFCDGGDEIRQHRITAASTLGD